MKKFFVSMLMISLIVLSPTQKLNATEQYLELCEKYGSKYEISPEILQGLIYVESRFDSNAVSAAGAIGLCQAIPKYNRTAMGKLCITDLTDPEQSIKLCAYTLAEYRDKGYEASDALTCYNRGESGAKKYLGTMTKYAKAVLEKAAELEEINGK